MVLRGLNWGHRRALGPMTAAAATARETLGVTVEWDVQTLAGFEHGLDARIAERFDLVVFDHPFCGTVAAQRLMQPLDAVLAPVARETFVGASLDSYRYAGHLWALPIDGATQCAVLRPDLLRGHAVPADWEGVLDLGRALRADGKWLGVPTRSPHGILLLLALCANLGHPLSLDPWATPFHVPTLRHAASLLHQAVQLARPDSAGMNAIDLHEAMSRDADLAYAPGVYAYLTYAEDDVPHPLRFAAFPGPAGNGAGTVLGGTGLGITRGCRDVEAAARLIRLLADPDAQRRLVMAHHGQPGTASAWKGCAEDARFGGAHAAIRDTVEQAWMRPRFPGYIAWQAAAGEAVERFIAGTLDVDALVAELQLQWTACAPALPLPAQPSTR